MFLVKVNIVIFMLISFIKILVVLRILLFSWTIHDKRKLGVLAG